MIIKQYPVKHHYLLNVYTQTIPGLSIYRKKNGFSLKEFELFSLSTILPMLYFKCSCRKNEKKKKTKILLIGQWKLFSVKSSFVQVSVPCSIRLFYFLLHISIFLSLHFFVGQSVYRKNTVIEHRNIHAAHRRLLPIYCVKFGFILCSTKSCCYGYIIMYVLSI